VATETRTPAEAGALAQGVRDETYSAQHSSLTVRDEVLMPVDPRSAKAAMDAYQATTAAILENSDWQGSPGAKGSFVKKSGWRKIAKAYKLSTRIVSRTCEHDDQGNPTRAEAVVRAEHLPSGQFSEGDGYCSVEEARFGRDGGRAKLENDLRATATTRAKNRAIADLVGMGAVSAEEADTSMAAGPMMKSPDAVLNAVTGLAIRSGAEPPAQVTAEFVAWVVNQHGYLPQSVGRSLIKLQLMLEEARADDTDTPWAEEAAPETIEGTGYGVDGEDDDVAPEADPTAMEPDETTDQDNLSDNLSDNLGDGPEGDDLDALADDVFTDPGGNER
jgi:hypothetical protein